tara:strand:- start:202 stop:672 length:471 start_codon:yes stop_codon:yes gene_type:complete
MANKFTARTGSKNLKARLLERKALNLRLKGWSYPKIAEKLGCSEGGAFKAVDRKLRAIQEESTHTVGLVRKQEVLRLDALLEKSLVALEAKYNPKIVDSIMKISARRASLLGLDAVQAQELHVISKLESMSDDEVKQAAMDIMIQSEPPDDKRKLN